MKRTSLFLFLFLTGVCAWAQNFNLTLRSSVLYTGQTCAGVWWHVDSLNNEYALVGASKGMGIVDVTNPSAPFKVTQIAGPDNKWKEIRTWNKFAYVTNEGDSGLQIIDLRKLPGTNLPSKYWRPTISGTQLKTIHALEIANGYLYLHGSNIGNKGTLIVDLADPWNPVYKGRYDAKYVHDGYVRNDTLYAGNIYDGYFSVINVTNKAAPVLLATKNTPHNFTHNTWLSDNSKVLFTTDEVNGSFLTSYDISNLGNITELDRLHSNPGNGAIVHNVYIRSDWAVNANNSDGINIVDVHRPANMVHVGAYDTYTSGSGGGFVGVWGACPYLPSKTILAASRDNYLHVLTPTYVRACYLEGTVTDSVTGNPINTANVEITTTPILDSSKITGNYAVGYHTQGTYVAKYSKPGYITEYRSVGLLPAVVTVKNVKLKPLSTLAYEALENRSSMQLYPNPSVAEAVFEFSLGGNEKAEVVLTDLMGHELEMRVIFPGYGKLSIGAGLPAGTYFVTLRSGGQRLKPLKFIKLN